jgi:hypothetical protein
MHRTRIVVFAAATVLALGACASAAPELTAKTRTPSPTATQTASPSPSPSPSSSPSPVSTTPPATPDPPVGNPCNTPGTTANGLPAIDFNRYATICLGMSFTQASTTMRGPTIAGQAECPWYADVLTIDDPGLYVAAVTYPENPGAEIFLFRMNWVGDLAQAEAFDAPSTQEGISVGSTTAGVRTVYPSATAVTVDDPARGTRNQLVVAGPAGDSFVFDVTSGRVDTMYWGKGIAMGASGELCAL